MTIGDLRIARISAAALACVNRRSDRSHRWVPFAASRTFGAARSVDPATTAQSGGVARAVALSVRGPRGPSPESTGRRMRG